MTSKRFPLHPAHPERNCWGCDRYCSADAMLCGNGSVRTQHPIETFGPGWESWSPPGAQQAQEAQPSQEAQEAQPGTTDAA